jgi:hypothetical protein
VRIVTDCTVSGEDDIVQETMIKIIDLREMYFDLKENSSVVLQNKRFTAVNNDRLLSVLILSENVYWSDIIADRRQSTFYG